MKEVGLLEELNMKQEDSRTFYFSQNAITAVTLLEEMSKGEASVYYPYLINLPMGLGIKDYPICYSPDELQYLQGCMSILD